MHTHTHTCDDINTDDNGVVIAPFVEYAVFLNAHHTWENGNVGSALLPLRTDLRNVIYEEEVKERER